MRLISLDELIFGELIEFQMQAGPLFARIRSRAYTYVEVSRQPSGEKKRINPVVPEEETSVSAVANRDTIRDDRRVK